jgi:hypothetical protein
MPRCGRCARSASTLLLLGASAIVLAARLAAAPGGPPADDASGSGANDGATPVVIPTLKVTITASASTIRISQACALNAAATGGTPPYTYAWNTGQSGAHISVSPPANQAYTVTVIDDAGRRATDSISVTVAAQLVLTASASPRTISAGSRSTLTARVVTGGVPPFSYRWSTGAAGQTIAVSPAQDHTYTVTARDAIGQAAQALVAVAVADDPPGWPQSAALPGDEDDDDAGLSGLGAPDPNDGRQAGSGLDPNDPNHPRPTVATPLLASGGICPLVAFAGVSLTLLGLRQTQRPRRARRQSSRQPRPQRRSMPPAAP